MTEQIIKMLVTMVLSGIKTETIYNFIKQAEKDWAERSLQTPTKIDDYISSVVISSEDSIVSMLEMLRAYADQKAKDSVNKIDDYTWLPISTKIGEVMEMLKAD